MNICTDILNYELLEDGNSVSKGVPVDSEAKKKYNEFKNGGSITDFVDTFISEMPFIPLVYRCASVNSNSAMAVSNSAIVSDYYNNIDKWKNVND